MNVAMTSYLAGAFFMMGCASSPPPSPLQPVASAPPISEPTRMETATPPIATSTDTKSPAPREDTSQRAQLVKAKASFEAFIARAGAKPEYASAVEEAKTRIEDIDRMLIFLDGDASAAPPPTP